MQVRSVSVTEFVDTEMRDYSVANSRRSIPSAKDGFKTVQRKLIYGAMKINTQLTVDRAGLQISAISGYKQSGDNVTKAIITMAQSFTATNNIPLIMKEGQFGTALDKDSSSPRYIDCKVADYINLILRKEDDRILEWRNDGGQLVEPFYYIPTIPLALVNGVFGTGTGYACSSPQYALKDVINNIGQVMAGKEQSRLVPSYNGYKGHIHLDESGQYTVFGKVDVVNTTTVKISEVPPKWDQEKFKLKVLIPLLEARIITNYEDDSNEENGWDITVKFTREMLGEHKDSLIDLFELFDKNTPNLTLWGFDDRIKKYKTPEELLEEFVAFRIQKYEERIAKQIEEHDVEIDRLGVINLFVNTAITERQRISAMNLEQLKQFARDTVGQDTDDKVIDSLVKLPLYKVTEDYANQLRSQAETLDGKITELKATSAVKVYTTELMELYKKLK